ncbi:MAG: hypothetical protein ACP5H2_03590 [Solirubrobacteraceae bacterium]
MQKQDVCDVCARTLLRGEHTEAFVSAGRHYHVCELCKPQALRAGWVREGALPAEQTAPGRERRPSMFARLRGRGGSRSRAAGEPSRPRTLDDELSAEQWAGPALPPDGQWLDQVPEPGYEPVPERPPSRARRSRGPKNAREPRRVHAVPAQVDHKIAAAVDSFNASSHIRTISGVARSLGTPTVNLTTDPSYTSTVWIVFSWELCWYRYEVDLTDTGENVRLQSQGYELSELASHELVSNAAADPGGGVYVY